MLVVFWEGKKKPAKKTHQKNPTNKQNPKCVRDHFDFDSFLFCFF